jgi:hypothetical protein
VALLLAGVLFLGSVGMPSLATNDPPAGGGNVTGDWTVTDTRSYSGVTINVAGNLIIQSGGSLTLSAVNLHINSASAANPYRIEVQSGGKLYTDSGTRIMTSTAYNFKFMLLGGSTGALSSTTIAKVGVLGNEFGRGVYIGSDTVRLDNCTVQNGYEGVHINSSAPSILNSTFKDCQYYGVYIEKAQPLVDNCTVQNNGHYGGTQGLYAEETYSAGRSCRISNCTIRDNEHGAYLNTNASALFENNTIVNSTVRGLQIRLCDPTVRLNNITQNSEHGIFLEQSGALIERNSITRNGRPTQLSAGIYIYYYSNPVIRDNYIAFNNDTGVHIRPQCAPAVKGNNITQNTNLGVKLNYCGAAVIENNNISINYDGINSLGSPPVIKGNALWANQNDGLHADAGDAVFEGNTVTGAGAAGIHALNGARMLVGNSTFTNCQWGVSAEGGSNILLVNGEFSNGFKEAFKCDSTATLDWVVDAPSFIDGNDACLRGNLTVMPGGRLSLSNMKMQVWSSSSIERNVELRSGGEMLLEAVNFTAYDPASNHRFTSAGKLQVLNSSVEEMGRDLSGNGENAGLFVNGGSAYFYNSQIYAAYIGLVHRGGSVLLESSSIANPEAGAVDARSSVLEARNSTIESGSQFCLRLDQSSRAELKVVKFNGNLLSLLDGPSVVNVYWYLRVQVRWANADPLAGATVRLSNAQGQPVWTRSTDQSGLTPWEEVQEYSRKSASKTSFTPHTINVTTGVFSSEQTVTVDHSIEYPFTFTDDTPPLLAITSPPDPSFLSTQAVELRGTASDAESGIRKVEVSWNNATWYNATTADGWATWNHTFNLVAASHILHARATNQAGNVSRARVSVTIEVTAPFLVIDNPREGALTNQTPVQLTGMTSADASVAALVNGAPANATQSNGRITGALDLAEGQNLIEITVTDRAGNFNSTTRNVTLDTVPPWITLERPPVSYTAQQSIDINGSTDGVQVTVNGMLATLANGSFTRTVILNYGAGTSNTTIEVVARDAAGNLNRTVIYVLRDLTPPNIRLAGAVKDPTNQTTAYLNGSTEPDATLTIQGVAVPLDGGGNFSYLFELQEGVNIITLVATDVAGNTGRRVLTIHRDTVAPALSVASPLDGSRTYESQIEVLGSTEPGAHLTINGEPVNIGLDGNFSKMHLALSIGGNNITLVASDNAGNTRVLVIRVARDESLPPPPPPPVQGPERGELETLLPYLLILLIIVGGAGAGAWAALSGRKSKAPPPRRPPGGRPMSPVEAQAARRGATGTQQRPKTAQELYGDDYNRKFSRPAAQPSPWQELPPPARTETVSWGAEDGTVQMNGPPVEQYEPPAEPYEPPQEPAGEPARGPLFGPSRPAAPGEAPAHPSAATKAVDSDIDDLLKKIGEVSKKK